MSLTGMPMTLFAINEITQVRTLPAMKKLSQGHKRKTMGSLQPQLVKN